MLEEMYYKVESIVRPITRHRRLWERAKYAGTKILSDEEGNALYRRFDSGLGSPQPWGVLRARSRMDQRANGLSRSISFRWGGPNWVDSSGARVNFAS